jgi:hypothetical protein
MHLLILNFNLKKGSEIMYECLKMVKLGIIFKNLFIEVIDIKI